jgi:hypothetical protein
MKVILEKAWCALNLISTFLFEDAKEITKSCIVRNLWDFFTFYFHNIDETNVNLALSNNHSLYAFTWF